MAQGTKFHVNISNKMVLLIMNWNTTERDDLECRNSLLK